MSDNPFQACGPIYDAAVDSERWRTALDAVLRPVGAKSAALLVTELQGVKPYSVNYLSGVYHTPTGARDVQYYVENLAPLEADAWNLMRTMPKHRFGIDAEIWPDLEKVRTRADFRFLEERFGVFRRVGVRLNDNRCWFDSMTLQYDAALTTIPNGSLETAQLLLPHLAKAIELGRSFSLLKMRYKAVLSALDHVEIGMCIALGRGEVIVANREAERIFDLDDGIRLARDQSFLCRDADLGRSVMEAIGMAAETIRGENNLAEVVLAVPRLSGKHPFLIEIVPLRDHAGEVEASLEGALITLIDPGNPKPFSTARLVEAYGLTRAEADVCRYLVDGWTNVRIAHERAVRIDTIKTQITSILQKTGTRRRSELIRLALKSSPPIAMPVQDGDGEAN